MIQSAARIGPKNDRDKRMKLNKIRKYKNHEKVISAEKPDICFFLLLFYSWHQSPEVPLSGMLGKGTPDRANPLAASDILLFAFKRKPVYIGRVQDKEEHCLCWVIRPQVGFFFFVLLVFCSFGFNFDFHFFLLFGI